MARGCVVGVILLSVLACSHLNSSPDGLVGPGGGDDTGGGTDDVPGDDSGTKGDDSAADDSGIPPLDADKDGFPSVDDCDDNDATVYPGAKDPVGDGVDTDCNGYDGPPLPGIEEIQVGNLVVTEMLIHSLAVDDSVGEWFEVSNVSKSGFDLNGLQIGDGGSDSFVVDKPTALLPGQAMVFGVSADQAINGGVGVDYEYAGFTLDDKSDAIILSNGLFVIDSVTYTVTDDVSWGEGATRSLDPSHLDDGINDDDRSWCAATTPYGGGELGTPGAANNDCPALSPSDLKMGELVIDEVMTDPASVDVQHGQWFEIYNASLFTVNIEGLAVRVDDTQLYHLTTAYEVERGGYAVIGTDSDTKTNGGVAVDAEWPPGVAYQLSITDGDLSIENASIVLDGISWRSDNGFPEISGSSMSLDPAHQNAFDNDDGTNWCSDKATFGDGDYGTPGTGNGC
jgi:hypothetical protein